MTSTELQKIIVSVLRNLDPDDPVIRSFYVAFRYRQKHASTDEAESDPLGLQAALERAFLVYTPDEVWTREIGIEEPSMFFSLDLAVAAESLAPDVYRRLVGRLKRVGREPKGEEDVRQFLACAFNAYSRKKEENLYPGP